jgi:hypothetical protein
MGILASRADFKAYILRRLGDPVIKINVSDAQVEDRIDEALNYYTTFHFDGTESMYYKKVIDSTDITNRYITLPDNVIGAIRFFDVGSYLGTRGIFDIKYQIMLSDVWSLTSVNLTPYVMTLQNLELIQQVLVGLKPMRYNRRNNRAYLDADWAMMKVGDTLIVECYQVLDPATYTDVWNELWLQNYATALVKRQWGEHLSKFTNTTMLGGLTFNGQAIKEEGQKEIEKLEEEMRTTWSAPISFLTG